jgi:hypothetical protein
MAPPTGKKFASAVKNSGSALAITICKVRLTPAPISAGAPCHELVSSKVNAAKPPVPADRHERHHKLRSGPRVRPSDGPCAGQRIIDRQLPLSHFTPLAGHFAIPGLNIGIGHFGGSTFAFGCPASTHLRSVSPRRPPVRSSRQD